jgi:hypothetical protein
MTARGDFSFVNCELSRNTLENTYKVIDGLGAWDYILVDEDIITSGLGKLINKISEREYSVGHSGTSWRYCMNHMKKIAEIGWDKYVLSWTRRDTI